MFLFLGENTQEVGKQFHVCLVFAAGSVVVVCVCVAREVCVATANTSVSIERNYAKFMESLSKCRREKEEKFFVVRDSVQIRNIQAERCISHLLGKYRQFFANYTSCCCVFDLERYLYLM